MAAWPLCQAQEVCLQSGLQGVLGLHFIPRREPSKVQAIHDGQLTTRYVTCNASLGFPISINRLP